MASLDNTLGSMYRNMIGLFNVDNTSDLNKPISTATQTSLDSKLNLTGGTLTGGLTGTTATFSGPLVTNGGLTGTTASFSADLTVFGRILCNLPNYVDNTTAKNAGVPIGALYRTGGIIKIRLDDIPPIVTLIGSSNLVVTTLTYTDPGVTATDNYDTAISVYLTSFLFNSTNIISSPVLITGTNTVVTTTTPLQFGNTYNLTYTAIDTTGNFSTISRNISVETPIVTTTYLYSTTNIRATSDRAPLPRYSNNNLYLENYSAWAPLTSSLNNIDFNIDNQWTFIFKVVQTDEQSYTIHLDPLFTHTGSGVWGTNTTYGYIGENDDTLAGKFYARLNDLVLRNPTYTVTNIQSGLTSEFITNSPSGYMIYIKYDSSKYLTIEMWSGNGATRYYTAKRNQPYTFVNKLAPFAFYSNVQGDQFITYQKGILYSNTNVAITAWNTYFP